MDLKASHRGRSPRCPAGVSRPDPRGGPQAVDRGRGGLGWRRLRAGAGLRLIVAAEDAKFGFPEVKWGLVPPRAACSACPSDPVTTSPCASCSPASRCRDRRRALRAGQRAVRDRYRVAHGAGAGRAIGRNAPLALAAASRSCGHPGAGRPCRVERQDRSPSRWPPARRHEGAVAFAERRRPVWHGPDPCPRQTAGRKGANDDIRTEAHRRGIGGSEAPGGHRGGGFAGLFAAGRCAAGGHEARCPVNSTDYFLYCPCCPRWRGSCWSPAAWRCPGARLPGVRWCWGGRKVDSGQPQAHHPNPEDEPVELG